MSALCSSLHPDRTFNDETFSGFACRVYVFSLTIILYSFKQAPRFRYFPFNLLPDLLLDHSIELFIARVIVYAGLTEDGLLIVQLNPRIIKCAIANGSVSNFPHEYSQTRDQETKNNPKRRFLPYFWRRRVSLHEKKNH